MEEKLQIDAQKGDYSRVPVEMWDRRTWNYGGEREYGALNVLKESIIIWWRRLPKCSGGVLVHVSWWV